MTHFEGPLTPRVPTPHSAVHPAHHVAVRRNYPGAAGKIRESSAAHRGAIDDSGRRRRQLLFAGGCLHSS